ncbi:MAG: hypothetical protein IJT91_05055 [Clostridia bacterium]|nr:hypothetical protein [Clostridia bacterium]
MKKFKIILPIILLALTVFASCGSREAPLKYGSAREALIGEGEVIHACGALYDEETGGTVIHTNSYEALDQNYDLGARVFEIDFNFTADGKLVCLHEWSGRFFPDKPEGVPLTEEEFLSYKIFGKYTHITLDMLAEFMKERPDVFVVTDIKDRCTEGASVIASEYPGLTGRFIIQIYDPDEYDEIRSLGFDNVILTLYSLTLEEKLDTETIIDFAEEHELLAITFGAPLCDIDGYVEKMKAADIPLLVHTVNGKALREKYLSMGISAVYTDYGKYREDVPEEIC